MNTVVLSLLAVTISLGGLAACSSPPASDETASRPTNIEVARPSGDQTESPAARLVNKVWLVTAPTNRAPGSFYIFLSDGTLVMTSCVETYRLATWRSDAAGRIAIAEDQAVKYEAEIIEIQDRLARLRLDLKNDGVELTLHLADAPYVCPDLESVSSARAGPMLFHSLLAVAVAALCLTACTEPARNEAPEVTRSASQLEAIRSRLADYRAVEGSSTVGDNTAVWTAYFDGTTLKHVREESNQGDYGSAENEVLVRRGAFHRIHLAWQAHRHRSIEASGSGERHAAHRLRHIGQRRGAIQGSGWQPGLCRELGDFRCEGSGGLPRTGGGGLSCTPISRRAVSPRTRHAPIHPL